MKNKSTLLGLSVGLALLVGIFSINRPEQPQFQPQSKAEIGRKSYGGSFAIESVRISDAKQPAIQSKK